MDQLLRLLPIFTIWMASLYAAPSVATTGIEAAFDHPSSIDIASLFDIEQGDYEEGALYQQRIDAFNRQKTYYIKTTVKRSGEYWILVGVAASDKPAWGSVMPTEKLVSLSLIHDDSAIKSGRHYGLLSPQLKSSGNLLTSIVPIKGVYAMVLPETVEKAIPQGVNRLPVVLAVQFAQVKDSALIDTLYAEGASPFNRAVRLVAVWGEIHQIAIAYQQKILINIITTD